MISFSGRSTGSMALLSFDATEIDAFTLTLARFAEGVTNFTSLWPRIRDVVYGIEREQFASEGAHGGEPWAPLSEKYEKWKRVNYPGQPILQRTGALVSEATGGPGAVVEYDENHLSMGVSVPYWVYHQSRAPRKKLPRRPIWQFSQMDKVELARTAARWLHDSWLAAQGQGSWPMDV